MTRNALYDNTKFLMIFLVVFGHLIEPLSGGGAMIRAVYMSIYSFHMPVFVLLCGLLTKPDPQGDQSAKIVQATLVPFVVFTLVYELFTILTTGGISGYSAGLQPHWLLWFLSSLFLWRLFSPVVMKFRYPMALALGLSLAAGYSDQVGYFLGLSRTLYFFPFFLIGQWLNGAAIDIAAYRDKLPRLLPVGILVVNLAVFFLADDFSARWLFGSLSYAKLGAPVLGIFIRLFVYALSLASALAVLLLIPTTPTWMSERGQNTLHVYVWHGLLVKLLALIGLIAATGTWPQPVTLVFWLAVSLPIAFALSSQAVANFTQGWLLGPGARLLLGKTPPAKTP